MSSLNRKNKEVIYPCLQASRPVLLTFGSRPVVGCSVRCDPFFAPPHVSSLVPRLQQPVGQESMYSTAKGQQEIMVPHRQWHVVPDDFPHDTLIVTAILVLPLVGTLLTCCIQLLQYWSSTLPHEMS